MPALKPEKQNRLEWAVILTAIGVYCLPFLDFGTTNTLPGLEAEYFQTFGNLLKNSLEKYGQFPLWNPYISTGLPYVADPMLHIYNPFTSLPILIFGVSNGFKLALFLSFLIAGLGMWWLGKELDLGGLGRLWLALSYAFSGVPAAKFIQGHYLMVFGFGWIPVALATILAARRSARRLEICLAALSLALVFLSGNGYYAYYLLYVLLIYALLTLFKLQTTPFKLTLDLPALKTLAAIGVLSLGLVAVQLLPELDYRDRYFKPTNPELSDSQNFKEILLDFTSTDPFRPSALSPILRPEEYYAYLGWWPFIALAGLPFSWKRKGKRPLLFFAALLVFTFLWIDANEMPWREVFIQIPFLAQFRYPSRMLVIGSLALIALSGLGLDSLRKAAKDRFPKKAIWIELLIGGFLLCAAFNLALTTRPLLRTFPGADHSSAAKWLRNYDPGLYYVKMHPNWHTSAIQNDLRYLNGGGPGLDASRLGPQISERPIEVGAKYFIYPGTSQAPAGAVLIKSLDGLNVYQTEASLPFVFILSESTLTTPGTKPLGSDEVTALTTFQADPNSFSGEVISRSSQALILLSTYNPNWQLTIDGIPAKVYNAYGYLAAEAQPGTHRYRFVYRPIWFFIGLAVSLITLLIVSLLMMCDIWGSAATRSRE